MSLLEVLKYPNKRLKEKSKEVKEFIPSIEQLVEEMFKTMYAKNGIGLAAPQVGELIRVIVMDIPIEDPIDPEKHTPDPISLINPKIIHGEGLIQYEEGCLSCPELIIKVDRQKKITVSYQTIEGKSCELKTSGLKAVCIQHEIDHLNGVLLVDRLSDMDRKDYSQHRLKIAKSEKDLVNVL